MKKMKFITDKQEAYLNNCKSEISKLENINKNIEERYNILQAKYETLKKIKISAFINTYVDFIVENKNETDKSVNNIGTEANNELHGSLNALIQEKTNEISRLKQTLNDLNTSLENLKSENETLINRDKAIISSKNGNTNDFLDEINSLKTILQE